MYTHVLQVDAFSESPPMLQMERGGVCLEYVTSQYQLQFSRDVPIMP